MQSPMSRKERLLAMLYDGAEPSLAEIARQLSLASQRQVRRLISALTSEGIRIETRRDGRIKRFWIPPEARPLHAPPHEITLAEEEALALAVAAEAASAALGPTPLAVPLRRAFDRLMERLGPHILTFESDQLPLRWHFDPVAAAAIDPSVFRTVMRAIAESRSIRIDYVTASTGVANERRKIDPYAIAVRGSSWLVVAYCRTRRRVLDFALAGISRAEHCDPTEEDAYFQPPESFDMEEHFRDRFSALAGGEVHVVRLLVEPDRAPYFRRKLYHPTQQIEEERADGRLVVSFEVAGLEEIRSFAQSWGTGITALEPRELVTLLAREAREVAGRYTTTGAS